MDQYLSPAKRRKLENSETQPSPATPTRVAAASLVQLSEPDSKIELELRSMSPTIQQRGRPRKSIGEQANFPRAVRKVEADLMVKCGSVESYRQLLLQLNRRMGVLEVVPREEALENMQHAAVELARGHLRDKAAVRRLIINSFGENLTTADLATCFSVSTRTIQLDRAPQSEVVECKHDRLITPDNYEV